MLVAACSSAPGFGDDDAAPTNDDASTSGSDGETQDAAAAKDAGTTTKDSGTTTADAGKTNDAGTTTQDSGIVANSSDGFGAVRTACINEINKLRASENHKAYALWETSAIDQCVDEQATNDQKKNSAHYSWINKVYPTCNGNAQDECLGYGNTVQGIVQCLDDMWDERLQSNCAGCAQCNGTTLTQSIMNCQSTSTCDFYGNYGPECGHYLNMSADYFTEAACGFSTVGSNQDWAVQNFK
jgi:hypothetical protein